MPVRFEKDVREDAQDALLVILETLEDESRGPGRGLSSVVFAVCVRRRSLCYACGHNQRETTSSQFTQPISVEHLLNNYTVASALWHEHTDPRSMRQYYWRDGGTAVQWEKPPPSDRALHLVDSIHAALAEGTKCNLWDALPPLTCGGGGEPLPVSLTLVPDDELEASADQCVLPQVFILAFAWQPVQEICEETKKVTHKLWAPKHKIAAVMQMLSTDEVNVNLMYDPAAGPSTGFTHRLGGFIAFSCAHLVAFWRHDGKDGDWESYDDSKVIQVGKWSDVARAVENGNWMPQLLFYYAL